MVWKSEKYHKLGTQVIHLLSLIFSEFQFVLRLAVPYLVLLHSFHVFFVKNGYSLVLGDREHQSMSLHLMQLCYFSVFFCLVFVDDIVFKWYRYIRNPEKINKTLILSYLFCLFVSCLFLFCLFFIYRFVYKFTFIHPFILSDNRHFVFYIFKDIVIVYFVISIWFRSLGNISWSRFMLLPYSAW